MSEAQGEEAQLSIKDRLNFPYILANQILTFQKSILAEEHSEREIEESIRSFVTLIPDDWKDKRFRKDLKHAKSKRKVDKRPQITGTIKMTEDACRELGIPAYVEEESIDYYALFQACINLLNRKKLLSRVRRVEKLEGIDFEHPTDHAVLESPLPSES